MIRYPNITGKNDAQKLDQMKSYLHQLADELNYQLDNTSKIGSGYPSSSVDAGSVAKPVKKDDAISNFNEIKGLIIKSADIVDAYSEEISKTLNGQYVAVSDFGTYKEETQAQLTASSDQIKVVLEKQEEIETNLDDPESEFRREISSEIQQTADSINLKVVNDTEGKMAGIQLTVGEKDSGQIDMTGLVTFSNLSTQNDKTVINGNNITTGKIQADYIDADNLVVKKFHAYDPNGAGIALNDHGLRTTSAYPSNPLIELRNDWMQTSGFLEETPYFDLFKTHYDRDITPGELLGGIYGGVHIDPNCIEFRSDIKNFSDYPTHSYDHTVDFGISRYGQVTGSLKVDTPTADTHAVNKAYVDTQLSGKAPAGYGLGTDTKYLVATDDLNYITQCGFYSYAYNGIPANGIEITSPFQYVYHVKVSRDANGTIVQDVTTCGASSGDANYHVRRVCGFGGWSPWEYDNPPMTQEAEYRTTERLWNSPVYKKLFYYGALPNGQSNANHGITDLIQVKKVTLIPQGLRTYLDHNPIVTKIDVDAEKVYITTNSNELAGKACFVLIEYVKS